MAPELAERLRAYFDLLVRWNARINLTSLGDRDSAIDRMLIEPLVAAQRIPDRKLNLLDIGSGGGSPSIPLNLARPRVNLTMVESKTRKAAFLREAIRTLKLGGASVETVRYEELLLRPEMHEAMGLVTVRAVRVDKSLLDRLQAFVAPGGQIFLFRGPSGPEVPPSVRPPLSWRETVPLVRSRRSRLVVLEKAAIGRRRTR
ncbi:MAG: 16S rRNA (guanine(527)-N(7))-methyltransferase RsmG [Vicinamibacterales bacterium]|nr:16S rRNA (guanine(527)-N(7))-methyltransferase RsmG [Vicinamibacterales bacterium]